MYRCAECGKPMASHTRGYRCAGHIMRTGAPVDEFVLEAVRQRLARPDLSDLLPGADAPEVAAIADQIKSLQGRVRRAEDDYDQELIGARDLKRVRDRAEGELRELHARRARLTAGDTLRGVVSGDDPAGAFEAADFATQRAVVDALMTVTLQPWPRGKRGFDPASVTIEWK